MCSLSVHQTRGALHIMGGSRMLKRFQLQALRFIPDAGADVQPVDVTQDDEGLTRRDADVFTGPHVDLQNLSVNERSHNQPIDIGPHLIDLYLRLATACSNRILASFSSICVEIPSL